MDKDPVVNAFEKLHEKECHGLPVDGAFDTISHLLSVAFGDVKASQKSIVLDVGSGAGYRTRKFFKGFNLVLLDCSNKTLKRAKDDQRVRSSVKYLLADSFKIPFSNESIDYVVSNGLNEHFFEPKRTKLFGEMYRVLKQDGRLVVITPNKLNIFHSINKYFSELRGTWEFGPQFDFTPFELYRKMKNLKFEYIEMFGVGAFTSWIRVFSRKKQRELIKKLTRFRMFNEICIHFDSNSSSLINKFIGREIMVVGYK